MDGKQRERLVRRLMHGQHTLKELKIGRDVIQELRDLGYRIRQQNGRFYITTNTENAFVFYSSRPKRPFTFRRGELSDTHAGSLQFDARGLIENLKRLEGEGFKEVHISGDLTDGFNVYPGHLNNLRYWKSEDQAAVLADILTKFNFNYTAIKGNHDYSFERMGGVNPIRILEKEVPNFLFLDAFAGDMIIGGVAHRMVHLDGGRAYAKSYPGQTYIRNLMDAEDEFVRVHGERYRLRTLQLGHFHTDMQYESSGVKITHPGNFQLPNDYAIRRGLTGPQGMRFTEFTLMPDGKVVDYVSRFVKPR